MLPDRLCATQSNKDTDSGIWNKWLSLLRLAAQQCTASGKAPKAVLDAVEAALTRFTTMDEKTLQRRDSVETLRRARLLTLFINELQRGISATDNEQFSRWMETNAVVYMRLCYAAGEFRLIIRAVGPLTPSSFILCLESSNNCRPR